MSEQTDRSRSRTKLVLLILMFLLPVAGSWYLVFFTDYARDGKGAEHGNLIKPPRQLENVELLRINETTSEQVSLFGKWSMLFFVDGSCDTACEDSLYRLRQIRLATGREMQRLQRVVIIDQSESAQLSDYLSKNYPGRILVKDFYNNFKIWNWMTRQRYF